MDEQALAGLLTVFRRFHQRACLLGPEGTGKTTLLEDLAAPIEQTGRQLHWVRLQRDADRSSRQAALELAAQLRADDVLLLDGGECLNRWEWWYLMRSLRHHKAGLLATLHRHRRLPILHQTVPDEALALQLSRKLAAEHWSEELEGIAREAFARANGNVREVFRACYWHCVHQ